MSEIASTSSLLSLTRSRSLQLCALVALSSSMLADAAGLGTFYVRVRPNAEIKCADGLGESCGLLSLAATGDGANLIGFSSNGSTKDAPNRDDPPIEVQVQGSVLARVGKRVFIPNALKSERHLNFSAMQNGTAVISPDFTNCKSAVHNSIQVIEDSIVDTEAVAGRFAAEPRFYKLKSTVPQYAPSPEASPGATPERCTLEASAETTRALISGAIDSYAGKANDYFRVSGIALLKTGKILLAISEYGNKSGERRASVLFVEGYYTRIAGTLAIDSSRPFVVAADLSERVKAITGKDVGLSGVEFNLYDGKLYFFTTYAAASNASPSRVTTNLWAMDVDPAGAVQPSTLAMARLTDNSTADFPSKSVGIAFLSSDTAVVIHESTAALAMKTGVASDTRQPIAISVFRIAKYPKVIF